MKHPDHIPEQRNQNHTDLLSSFSAADLETSLGTRDSSLGTSVEKRDSSLGTSVEKRDSSLGTSVEKRGSSSRSFGLTLAAVFGFTGLTTIAIAFPFIKPGFRRICLPYVPASDAQVSNVVKALRGSEGKVIDLGSGDGRLVFAAARLGYHSTGVDLNPWLIIFSRIRSRFLGLNKVTKFEKRNLFQVDFSSFNNIIIFGVDDLMPSLEELLTTHSIERNKTLKVIACRFPFPNLKPIVTIGSGIDTVWIYKIPS